MAQISPELQRQYALLIGNIPAAVRKAIDDDELRDRLVMADDLMRRSQQARTPGEGRALGARAQRVLGARPRAETTQIVVAKMAKAKALGRNTPQAAVLERQAREELDLNPPAVRRKGGRRAPVAKGAPARPCDMAPVMVLYDADGNAWAIDPDSPDLRPVGSAGDVAGGQ